jgi:peptidylprolyl isomerase
MTDLQFTKRANASLAWLIVLCASLLCARGAEPTADGLYAGFVTSEGTFWCRLEYVRTPRTVANFVQLAEGTRPWVDFAHARIEQRPFYTGLTFHRVIKGFMNQGGSPNGLGTDGPGYQFKDEFHPQLRHNKPGILSMANSGANSNGSQFFVTVEPTPWLDDKHSVFGEVVDGLDIVFKINSVPTTNDVPIKPVVMNEVRVLRRGTAATAFDPAAVTPPLPAVGTVVSQLTLANDTLALSYPTRAGTMDHVFFGNDFRVWGVRTFTVSPVNASSLLGQPQVFFLVLSGGYEP